MLQSMRSPYFCVGYNATANRFATMPCGVDATMLWALGADDSLCLAHYGAAPLCLTWWAGKWCGKLPVLSNQITADR